MSRKLALIAGGTSGIGFGVASALALQCDLALGYSTNHDKARAARDELTRSAPQSCIRTYGAHLSTHQDAERLVAEVVSDFGRSPDVLVNSVGSLHDCLFLDSEFEMQHKLVEEHLVIAMSLSHLVLRNMYKTRFGRIINIGSISAKYAKRGQCGYAAAKAGIEGFSRTLALEVGHRGITVNVIAAGLIETPLTTPFMRRLDHRHLEIDKRIPVRRVGTPADVGSLVEFLCSENAAYVTGAVFTVDGGRSLGDMDL